MGWIFVYISIALLVGVFIGYNLKPDTPSNDDPTGEIKKGIMEKLDKIIEDVKSTV